MGKPHRKANRRRKREQVAAAPYGSLLYPSGRHSVFYEEHLDSYFFYFRDTIDRRTLLRRSNP